MAKSDQQQHLSGGKAVKQWGKSCRKYCPTKDLVKVSCAFLQIIKQSPHLMFLAICSLRLFTPVLRRWASSGLIGLVTRMSFGHFPEEIQDAVKACQDWGASEWINNQILHQKRAICGRDKGFLFSGLWDQNCGFINTWVSSRLLPHTIGLCGVLTEGEVFFFPNQTCKTDKMMSFFSRRV